MTEALPASLLSDVHALLDTHQIATHESVLRAHGRDESFRKPVPPQLVVYPETTQQVSELMKMCHQTSTPVVPFGGGTSVEGHVAALHGGVCIDLSRMKKVLEISLDDFCCRVEAGTTRHALDAALKDTGLFFSVDPGANATIGGMISTRASGTNTVRYGTMRENLLGCTVVLANGDIVKTGSKAVKSSAGYDLTHLMCGSEGTLGIITEALVKLHPRPESVAAAICTFPTVKAGVACATAVIQRGISIARIEFLDEVGINSVNGYSNLNLKVCPTLFFEFVGTFGGVKEQSMKVSEIAKEFDGSDFQWETSSEGRERLWEARHNAHWASLHCFAPRKGLVTDVCVPISKLAECIVHAQKLTKEYGIPAHTVGHVGDGNFHSMLLIEPDDKQQVEHAEIISDAIVEKALSCGGTCTGEHGVGHGKLKYLKKEHGEEAVEAMRCIKQALDPKSILNPGKLGS